MRLAIALASLCTAFAAPASAQVLLQENFTFTGLLTNNGWTGFSGTTNFISAGAPQLTFPNLPSSGSGNSAGMTNTGQDAYKLFTTNNSTGNIYTSFLINVSSAGAGDYFYSLYSTNTSGGGFFTRIFAQTNASGFSFGVSRAQSTNALVSYETNVRSFNTTYLVVAKMSRVDGASNDIVSLWVDPVLGGAESTPLLTNNSGADNTNSIAAVALRQGTTTPGARVGNILVGTTWASVTPSAGLPAIVPVGSFTNFSTVAGTVSASQSLVISATNLTAAITATAPTGLQVSADNSIFGPTASLPLTGGTLYARVAATAIAGEIASSITLSSAGATDVAVPVTAAVRPTSISLPYGPDTFATSSFPWTTFTVAGTKDWVRASAGGNSFMEINGFDAASNAVPANAWLILGPFNVPAGATNVVAQFNLQRAFNSAGSDAELSFKFSTNYAGSGNPSSAGWSDVSFPKPLPVAGTNTTFSPSGAVSLPPTVAGRTNLYVAYQLQATNATNTSRWRMDDFELFTSSLPVLSVVVNPNTIDEGQGATGTVTLPSVPSEDVNVTVASADAALVQVDGGASTVVTVPGGANPPTAQFSVSTTRNFEVGPDVPVQITAEAGAAYEFGQTIVTVRNIDVPSASLTSAGYSQSFAAFTSAETLPLGWSILGSAVTYGGDWGTGTSAGSRGNASVFGYQHTGSSGVVQQVLTLKNDTGAEINDLVIGYTGRMAVPANGRDPAYTVTVDGVAYPALAYSTSSGDNVPKAVVVSGLFISPGQTFQVNWSSDGNTAPGSGSRRQIGISSVSVSVGSAVLPPTVSSFAVPLSTIGQTSAQASADVAADNGAPVTARGFVYAPTSVNPDPLIGGTGVVNVVDSSAGTGTFSGTLSGLTGSTQYSIKAYATNAQGTSYTTVQTFTTLGAPLGFTGTYLEPFNDFTGTTSPLLASGVIKAGWTAISSLNVQTYSGLWTSASSNAGFYGGVSNPGVVGYQHTSSTGTMTVTLRMVNNTGSPLTQLYVKYLGRVEKVAETRLPQWDVTVAGVAAPSLTYSTGSGVDETKSDLVTGLNVPAGGEFTVTWVSQRGDGANSSRRIGLANVVLSTSPIPDPAINVTGSLAPFTTTEGTASAAQSFNASGVGLTGNLTVTAPTNYEVSLDNSTFASSVSLTPVNGTVASTPVYVRIAATAPVGNPAGTVSLASSGATTQNVAVTGTVSGGGSAYDTWASGFGLNPATNGAPTADPDGDSFTNAQEYAFGTNPTVGNGSLLTTTASGGNLVVAWLERSDVTYNVQSTANLASTAFANDGSVTVQAGPAEPTPPAGYTRKQFSVPASGSKFYRVTATTPAP